MPLHDRNPSLRAAAEAIWRAGVAAVDSETLVAHALHCDGNRLSVCGHDIELREGATICVVGAGKAGAGMATGVERALEGVLLDQRMTGWINVPADCVRTLRMIHLHAARPAGVNEPAAEGVAGTARILDMVSQLAPADVCVVLLSGGGSALLPAPVEGISLEDKQQVTRHLMQRGATIGELNCVRRQLSRIKGGGLARACTAGTLVVLIISDVIGDPLETIASGPTVFTNETPADALAVLQRYGGAESVPASVWGLLSSSSRPQRATRPSQHGGRERSVQHYVIGNNRVALDAAAERADELGYDVIDLGSDQSGVARDVGADLANRCRKLRDDDSNRQRPVCLLSGGEPVVPLQPGERLGKGGRNQELVLAAVDTLWTDGMQGIAILSGGTDGEDGPTDAAGAMADADVMARAKALGLVPSDFLANHDSYPFFEQCGGLLQTGPTHTNVMDLRVAIVD